MKKILITTLAAAAIATPAYAKEISGLYGKLSLGFGHAANYKITHKDTVNTSGSKKARGQGWTGSGAFGYGSKTGMRSEFELFSDNGLRGHKAIYNTRNNVKITSTVGFLNGYYDFFNSSKATPFIFAGAGWGTVETKFSNNYGSQTAKKTGLSYQLGLGTSYDFTSKTQFEFSYRYLMADNKKLLVTQNIPGTGPVSFSLNRRSGEVHVGMLGIKMYL
jgi:opacity protein-like surface antigen